LIVVSVNLKRVNDLQIGGPAVPLETTGRRFLQGIRDAE
jgi:hypothetical protein